MAGFMDRFGLGVKLEFDANNANSAMDKTGRNVHKLTGSFDALSMNMWRVQMGFQQLSQAITLPALAAAGAVGMGVKAVADWETGLAHVASTMPKAVAGTSNLREAIRLFGDDVEKTSIRFGFAMADTTKGLYDLIGAGVATGDASEFMKLASEAAVAGFTDVRFATDALTTVVNAYGDALGTTTTALQKASYISDIMFTANRLGKTEFVDMARYLGITASTAAKAGIQFKELAAMTAVMSAQGRRTRSIFTDLAQTILSIANPPQGAIRQAKKELPELAKYLGEAALKKYGLYESLSNIMRLTEGKTFEGRSALGVAVSSLAAWKTAAFFSADSAKKYTDAMTEMNDAGGATHQIFMDTSQILSHNFNRALQAGISVMRRFGRGFLDAFGIKGTTIGVIVDRVEESLDAVQSIAHRFFSAMRRGFQELRLKERLLGVAGALDYARARFEAFVGSDAGGRFWRMSLAVMALTAALSPALLLITPFILGISGIVTIIGGMAAILAPIGGLIALAFSPAVLPWIAGIAVAIYVLWNNSYLLNTLLPELGRSIVDLGRSFGTLAGQLGLLAGTGAGGGFGPAAALDWLISSATNAAIIALTGTIQLLALTFHELSNALAMTSLSWDLLWGNINRAKFDEITARMDQADRMLVGRIKDYWLPGRAKANWEPASNLPWANQPVRPYASPFTGGAILRSSAADPSLVDQIHDFWAKLNKPPSAEETKAEYDKRLADFKAVAEDVLRQMGINVNTSVNLDGRQLASAMGRTSMEISERGGGRIPPWQRARVNAGRAVYSTTPGH